MATRKGTGMVKVRKKLCRNKKGQYTRCRGKMQGGKGSGHKRKHAKKHLKGRCVKWSKGRTRCMKRAK